MKHKNNNILNKLQIHHYNVDRHIITLRQLIAIKDEQFATSNCCTQHHKVYNCNMVILNKYLFETKRAYKQ